MKKILFLLICMATFLVAKAQVADTIKTDSIKFNHVDQEPDYPGGIGKLLKYITKNLKYPKQAKKDELQGTVRVSFVIERDGSLTNMKIVKSLSAETDAEAIRLITNGGKWIPGLLNGQPIRVQYQMPVYFRLDE